MPEAGGMKPGVARMLRGERVVTHEFMVLGAEDATPVFRAQPSSSTAPTRSLLARRDGARFIFENVELDFPQRVIYADPATGAVFARIEGTSDGPLRALDFLLQRVACPAL